MDKKIKIYLPIKKNKKSNIRGFWLSDDKKLYYDYIKIIEANISDIENIRKKYNELAIFYTDDKFAYIWNGKKTEVLKENKTFIFIYGICNIKKQLKRLIY